MVKSITDIQANTEFFTDCVIQQFLNSSDTYKTTLYQEMDKSSDPKEVVILFLTPAVTTDDINDTQKSFLKVIYATGIDWEKVFQVILQEKQKFQNEQFIFAGDYKIVYTIKNDLYTIISITANWNDAYRVHLQVLPLSGRDLSFRAFCKVVSAFELLSE